MADTLWQPRPPRQQRPPPEAALPDSLVRFRARRQAENVSRIAEATGHDEVQVKHSDTARLMRLADAVVPTREQRFETARQRSGSPEAVGETLAGMTPEDAQKALAREKELRIEITARRLAEMGREERAKAEQAHARGRKMG